jgi:TonB family protein
MMVRRPFSLFFVVFVVLAATQAPAQNQTQTQTPPAVSVPVMPNDPTQLMQLAPQVNGLGSPDMKPWHLKATYQTFDDQGKPINQGTFEEWWAGPKKDRRVYTSAAFTQTEYRTAAGNFRVGSQDGPPLSEYLVRARLIDPMPAEKDMEGTQLQRREDPFPKTKLNCVELARPMKRAEHGSPVGLFPLYCFDTDKPILRFSGSYGLLNSSYERIGELAGHYIGLDVRISDWKTTFVTIHVESANLLSQVNDVDFIPPVETQVLPAGAVLEVPSGVLAGRKLSGSVPAYPVLAKQGRIEGRVSLAALISEDGHIRELRVVEAPDPSLALAALMAVHDWRYQPYLLNGHPVEVQTTINVIYRLGG